MDEKKFNFTFSFFELTTILKACKKLPYEETAKLIERIIDEYEVQAKKLEEANKK